MSFGRRTSGNEFRAKNTCVASARSGGVRSSAHPSSIVSGCSTRRIARRIQRLATNRARKRSPLY